jgi:hypothetical protein
MKVNWLQLVSLLVGVLLSILMLLCLGGCSAKWHYEKALKKGMRCETTSDTIRIRSIDSLIINGEKTYFYTTKDTIIHFNTVYVPKTRWQTRIEYRYKTRIQKQYIKQQAKVKKAEAKESGFNSPLKLLVVVAGLLALIYLFFKWK